MLISLFEQGKEIFPHLSIHKYWTWVIIYGPHLLGATIHRLWFTGLLSFKERAKDQGEWFSEDHVITWAVNKLSRRVPGGSFVVSSSDTNDHWQSAPRAGRAGPPPATSTSTSPTPGPRPWPPALPWVSGNTNSLRNLFISIYPQRSNFYPTWTELRVVGPQKD